jgi:hypothetical protein
METKSNQQFELALYHNNRIICQRYFEDYNFKKNDICFDVAINIIKSTTEMITNHLKSETMKHLYSKYNCVLSKVVGREIIGENQIKVVICHNKKPFASSCININVYPAKIRHSIDIRPIIPAVISKIRNHLKKA